MKQVLINLYSFNELSKKAQQKAIYSHAEFMATMPVMVENEAGEMEEIFEEFGSDFEDEQVIDNIEANDYLFFEDGKLAHCTTYTGGHHKAGITELHFHGKTIDITK